MSTTSLTEGFCFICGDHVDDVADHFAQTHQGAAQKPKVPIMSWQDRLEGISKAIEEVRQESDIAIQINKLDHEVIQEVYLVRARLSQMQQRNVAQAKKG